MCNDKKLSRNKTQNLKSFNWLEKDSTSVQSLALNASTTRLIGENIKKKVPFQFPQASDLKSFPINLFLAHTLMDKT